MNLHFEYNGEMVEMVNAFSYLSRYSIVFFTAGGSFNQTQITRAGQSRQAYFKINKYLYNFTNISIKHRLELFDKLVLPILNYGCKVWGFRMTNNIERVHNILSVKRSTQNKFVYGELSRFPLCWQYF